MHEIGFELSTGQQQLCARAALFGARHPQIAVDLARPLTVAEAARRLGDAIAVLEILRTSFPVAVGAAFPLQLVSETLPTVTVSGGDITVAFTGLDPHLGLTVASNTLMLWATDVVADHASLFLLAQIITSQTELAEDPLQYADYAGWEAEQRAVDSPERRLAAAFWWQPTDNAADADLLVDAEPDNAAHAIIVPVPAAADASADTWLAAWVTVLARNGLLDPDDALMQVQVPGRSGPDLEEAIGPYARSVTVTVPNVLSETASSAAQLIASVLRQAERFCTFAPTRTAARCTVGHGFRHLPAGSIDFDADETLAHELVLVGYGSGCTAFVISRRGERPARRLSGHLSEILAEVGVRPEAALGDTTMLTADETRDLRANAAGPALDPGFSTVLDAFSRQLDAVPERIAVADSTRSLSYRELDERANALARTIQSLRPTLAPASVFIDRSVDSVVAMLAAMRCGRPFQPVRADLPPVRLVDQLDRSGADVVVAVDAAGGAITSISVPVLTPADALTVHSDVDLPDPPVSDDCAYLLATSGSTGIPKLVEVAHRNLLGYTRAVTERLGLAPGCRLGVVTSLSTDLAYTMVFPALASGGTVRLFAEDEVADVRALDLAVRREQIDAVKMTPSLLRALLAAEDAELAVPLLVLGGEALSFDLVERAYRAGAGRVVNHYGPTETTVGAVTSEFPRDSPATGAAPIGRPLPGVQAYIVDAARRLCPWGVAGHLAIAGVGVSAGYRGDAEGTAAAFVRLPGGVGEGTAYLTGDVARLTPDGDIVFGGRADNQVKIRGYRVELGDIEHALREHAALTDAAVVVDDRDPEGDTLIAYVVGPLALAPSEIRAWLAQRVPVYMVADHVVVLGDLPRMPNGKLDRAALPEPSADYGDGPGEAPATETERHLLKIWADVLPEGRLDVTDDFFYVGGHSLLATRIMARARSDFGVELPLHLIFSHSTVRAMSSEIDTRVAAESNTDGVDAVLASIEDMDEDEARIMLERELRRSAGNE